MGQSQPFQTEQSQFNLGHARPVIPVTVDNSITPADSYCQYCRARSYCLPAECHNNRPHHELDHLIQRRRVLHEHHYLFRQHDKADFLMVLSSGVCKSYFVDSKSREHVCGFFYPGDLIGIEALYSSSYQSNVVMLETGSTCYIPIAQIRQALTTSPELQQQVIKMLSQQLSHEYVAAGSFSAEERVVQFLLELSQKQKRLGYSDCQLRLFMSRNDIANYLGMRSETVSRVLTRLGKQHLISVSRDLVTLCDIRQLHHLSAIN
ncbi:hypothetical protein EHN06_07020 [Marinobacter sp. NP-4(2019)]|uniref:Crp/Fnr family transcriptional regulator n=1 Tax=Marinobacter sp. NP-4(2019) TaxID=2488665 RepID=UPI000FC3EA27|nr:helix-turn-helix domain-containing protein [Marinobacter sp. NP-4(2019)]AZT83322.1 hypothetical protein EHN06_07020 [Marinobacter sp. NP-4(2019)]